MLDEGKKLIEGKTGKRDEGNSSSSQ